MKCALCNERNGSTRCEGCQTLFCLTCMIKHHDELLQQFQQLMDARNELKQTLDTVVLTSQNDKTVPCVVEIDQWEEKIIRRIRQIAARVRSNVHETMTKSMAEINRQFEQLSVDIQQQQKEGNYLENDINSMRTQLEKLKNDIQHVKEKVKVDSTMSNDIEWDSLIYVIEGENLPETPQRFSDYYYMPIVQDDNLSVDTRQQSDYGTSSQLDSSDRIPSSTIKLDASQQANTAIGFRRYSEIVKDKVEQWHARNSRSTASSSNVPIENDTSTEIANALQHAATTAASRRFIRIVEPTVEQPSRQTSMNIDSEIPFERPPWKD